MANRGTKATNMENLVFASSKGNGVSPFKARLVADMVRGMKVFEAKELLKHSPQKSAGILTKILNSAIANAENNNNMDTEDCYLVEVRVDEGPTLKRMRARARGRGDRFFKRTCHISLAIGEKS